MKQINVYNLIELKEQFAQAYERVLKRWSDAVAESGDIPWSREVMDSLKAVIELFGGELADWQIGPYGPCSATVRGIEDEEWTSQRLLDEVLTPLGYARDRQGHFPGLCKLTGYCADDDFLEGVYERVTAGQPLTSALESLAGDAGKMMEADLEQQQDGDSMLANWGDRHFTEAGTAVD